MTREEAIYRLENMTWIRSEDERREDIQEAIDMAIDALQKPKCYWCAYWNSETKGCKRNPSVQAWEEDDYCSYYAAIEALSEPSKVDFRTDESANISTKIKLDLISRADAIEAVCGDCSIETKNNCKEEGYCYEVRNLKALPSADAEFADLPDIPRAYYEKVVGKMAHEINMLKEQLESADRPQGEWVIRENGNKECSLCGHEKQDGWDYFCGYCGARMETT